MIGANAYLPRVSREAVYAALFARVSSLPGVVTASRRLQHWTDVRPVNQPALFMVQRSETVTTVPGLPPRHQLEVAFYLYASAGNDADAVPAILLNSLNDALSAALAPDEGGEGRQTLDGLVYSCAIKGKIETDEGTLGGQSVAIVPVEILLT